MTQRWLGSAVMMLAGMCGCTHEVVVASADDAPARHVIEVVGSGEAEGAPNLVRLTLGVEAQSTDPQAAVAEASTKLGAVLAALAKHGVDAKDVQTQQLNIHSEERPPQPLPLPEPVPLPEPGPKGARPGPAAPSAPPLPERPPIVYRVNNGVQVTLRDLTKVGEAVGAAVQAGANQAWGIQFDVEDESALQAQARQKAMQDAARRAKELATLGGVKLGRVLSITEEAARDVPGPGPMFGAMSRQTADVPIEAGQLRLVQSVKVVYELRE